MNNVILNPLERNEMIKAMIGRGIDYETSMPERSTYISRFSAIKPLFGEE